MSYKDCFFLSIFTVFLLATALVTQASRSSTSYGGPTTETPSEQKKCDESLNGLQWNRYVRKNFVVLSIDDNQGRWLHNNIEKLSSYCAERWGLKVADAPKECRIFCVPTSSLLKSLFNLDQANVAFKNDPNVNVIWANLERPYEDSILPYLSRVILSDGFNRPWWFLRAAQILSSPVKAVHSCIEGESWQDITPNDFFSLSYDSYLKLSKDKKEVFDRQALIACLMLRKELGQIKFLEFLRSYEDGEEPSSSLVSVYGYKGGKDFSLKCSRYYSDLLAAIRSNKVPDSYFSIQRLEDF